MVNDRLWFYVTLTFINERKVHVNAIIEIIYEQFLKISCTGTAI
jgi:hypothetical protein